MRLTAAILVLLSGLSVVAQAQNEEAVRLEDHVRFLSSDSLWGRQAGSAGELEAARYVYDCLYDAGVSMLSGREGQVFSIVKKDDTLTSRNIVGVVEGYDDVLKSQYIVLGANMDHIGTNLLTVDGATVMQIYHGADDNASGTAVMLEVARRVAASAFLFKRSVIFVGFGAKEQGMAGSWYFVNRTFPYADSISVMLDVRMVGGSGPMSRFTYYNGTSSPEINSLVDGLSQTGAFYIPERGVGVLPSGDYLPFYEKNIPVVLFTTGQSRSVRTTSDTADLLDYESMDYVCDFLYNFSGWNQDLFYFGGGVFCGSGDPAAFFSGKATVFHGTAALCGHAECSVKDIQRQHDGGGDVAGPLSADVLVCFADGDGMEPLPPGGEKSDSAGGLRKNEAKMEIILPLCVHCSAGNDAVQDFPAADHHRAIFGIL